MATTIEPIRRFKTAAEVIEHLGVPADRILLRPEPGTATIEDALKCTGPRSELVDGVLVKKPMGFYESRLAILLGHFVEAYLENDDLGFTLGESGMVWVAENQMRMADVSFVFWHHFPGRLLTRDAVLDRTPDWAVEILSPTNTRKEMTRKRREYFAGGAKLVWLVYPDTKTVEAYTAPETFSAYHEDDTVTAAPVLPGFSLSIKRWFDRAGQRTV